MQISLTGDGPLTDRFDLSWHPHGRYSLEEKVGKAHGFVRAIQYLNRLQPAANAPN
jgi:hypothetical protein